MMYRLGRTLDTPDIRCLCALYEYPYMQSYEQYINKYLMYCHWQPKHATGNHDAKCEVRGQALVNLFPLPRPPPQGTHLPCLGILVQY